MIRNELKDLLDLDLLKRWSVEFPKHYIDPRTIEPVPVKNRFSYPFFPEPGLRLEVRKREIQIEKPGSYINAVYSATVNGKQKEVRAAFPKKWNTLKHLLQVVKNANKEARNGNDPIEYFRNYIGKENPDDGKSDLLLSKVAEFVIQDKVNRGLRESSLQATRYGVNSIIQKTGDIPVTEFTGRMIEDNFDRWNLTEKQITLLKAILKKAVDRDYIAKTPPFPVMVKKETKHFESIVDIIPQENKITFQDVKSLIETVKGSSKPFVFDIWLLSLHLACRPNEAITLKKEHVNLSETGDKAKTITRRSKTKDNFTFPVTPEIEAIIKPYMVQKGRYLFLNENNKKPDDSEGTFENKETGKIKHRFSHGANVKNTHHTWHGNRTLFRRWAEENRKLFNVSDRVIEMCLSHDDRGSTERAYNRTDYLADRRQVMEAWSKFLTGQEITPTGEPETGNH